MTKANVQGRLNRETNPIPGERPGFNPQFIDSDGYATDVTPNTPFPSGSYVQTDAGVWVPQKGSDDGAAHVQLTGSNVEHQLLDQVQISAGSIVFSQNLTHFADKYSVYVQSNPASDFSISIRPRRLDGVESGEGVDRFEESYTDRVRIVTDEFISRSPSLNIGIRNDTSEVVTYSAWVYVKGASN